MAEVLITLGIIGMIADLTLPSLLADFSKIQYTVSLKKAYTNANQVLIQLAGDMGCPGDLKCTGLFENDDTTPLPVVPEDIADPAVLEAFLVELAAYYDNLNTPTKKFGAEFVKYMKTVKDCGTTAEPCGSDKVYYMLYTDSQAANVLNDTNRYRFITADGMSWAITASDCGTNVPNNPKLQLCGTLHVDTNGYKKPNRYGRDMFGFYITNGKGPLLQPYGLESSIGFANTLCELQGDFCSAKIMREGWQMNY